MFPNYYHCVALLTLILLQARIPVSTAVKYSISLKDLQELSDINIGKPYEDLSNDIDVNKENDVFVDVPSVSLKELVKNAYLKGVVPDNAVIRKYISIPTSTADTVVNLLTMAEELEELKQTVDEFSKKLESTTEAIPTDFDEDVDDTTTDDGWYASTLNQFWNLQASVAELISAASEITDSETTDLNKTSAGLLQAAVTQLVSTASEITNSKTTEFTTTPAGLFEDLSPSEDETPSAEEAGKQNVKLREEEFILPSLWSCFGFC